MTNLIEETLHKHHEKIDDLEASLIGYEAKETSDETEETMAIASTLDEEELADLKDQFQVIDVDKSGLISFEEMKQALAKDVPWRLRGPRVPEILQAIDSNTDGLVDLREFVAATLHVHQMEQDSDKWHVRCKTAFDKFDMEGDGYITPEELRMCPFRYFEGERRYSGTPAKQLGYGLLKKQQLHAIWHCIRTSGV
ncbi:calcium-dependent protein kinase 4-like isoform X2 [Zingiber officinale]|uniref:calcium-dependent protein kinase 4-like isoform X2 n=1 Tax=Zingiber officinale TaxID=94328 RepID=UPI001C4CB7CD|nr:calcium-dependent protein kinase 4-like isoform X2 [Zingiber officinale]